jgi:hypothetical protein
LFLAVLNIYLLILNIIFPRASVSVSRERSEKVIKKKKGKRKLWIIHASVKKDRVREFFFAQFGFGFLD